MTQPGHVSASVDRRQLGRLKGSVEADIEAGRYHGAVLIVARHGEVVLEEAIGLSDAAAGRKVQPDDVFHIFSATKALINVLAFRAFDRGLLALNTRVAEVIGEFTGDGRDRVTVGDLLSHRSGLPATTPLVLPGCDLGDLAAMVAVVCQLELAHEPGTVLTYAAAVNHVLLGEMARRVYGDARLTDTLRRELLDPLGLHSTALGTPESVADRVVPLQVVFTETSGSGWMMETEFTALGEAIATEGAELPWVGGVASAGDLFRLAEMFRRGGELDGERIVSRAVLDNVTVNQTGSQPDQLNAKMAAELGWRAGPGNQSYGFGLAGNGVAPSRFGTLTSPGTYGHFGAGSSALFWVDPVRDMTFVCLTAGLMAEHHSVLRLQRLSDLAVAAAV
jgi:CubicO group peptidase (beta-lactamase class C family)